MRKNLSTKKATIEHLKNINAHLTIHQIKEGSAKTKIINYSKSKGG